MSQEAQTMETKLSLIVKAQHAFIALFEAEDDGYVDGRMISARRRAYDHYIQLICKTDTGTLYNKTCDAIENGTWTVDDHTFKPICDRLRMLGYTIIEGK